MTQGAEGATGAGDPKVGPRGGPWRRRIGPILLWTGAALLLGGLLLATAAERREARDSPVRAAERLQGEVREARAAWSSCLDSLDAMERRFRTQAEETEGLGARIRELEGLDPRGVPAARYEAYLDAVARYNAGIAAWEAWAEALDARQAACRTLLEARNVLADSLRTLLREAGYLPTMEEDAEAPAPRDTLPLPPVPGGSG